MERCSFNVMPEIRICKLWIGPIAIEVQTAISISLLLLFCCHYYYCCYECLSTELIWILLFRLRLLLLRLLLLRIWVGRRLRQQVRLRILWPVLSFTALKVMSDICFSITLLHYSWECIRLLILEALNWQLRIRKARFNM